MHAGEAAETGDPLAAHGDVLSEYLAAVSDAAAFFKPDGSLTDRTKQLLAVLHAVIDQVQNGEGGQPGPGAPAALRQLHTAGFDAEQIWTQVDSKTSAVVKRARCSFACQCFWLAADLVRCCSVAGCRMIAPLLLMLHVPCNVALPHE